MFERAFTQQRLLDAWEEARDAAYADGEVGAEVERFETAAARNVSEIAEALATGTFEPKPVHRVEIAKSGGGTRKLAIPSLEDRIVERALLAELDRVIDPLLLPWSFAYRKGLGVKDAIAALTEARDEGAQWVARCDIDDCFEHIPRWEVVRRLREVVNDLAVIDLVRKFMDRPVIGERTPYAERGLGLHQGSPFTPPTQLRTFAHVTLRVGCDVVAAAVPGRVLADGDSVADGELVGPDEDVLDEGAQDSLPVFGGGGGGVLPEPG
jgi:CRISPR-associated protein Cas1